MKLSKSLLAILAPVATACTVVPVVSCGKALVLEFGDSVNCLSKKNPYKTVAKYYKPEEVYAEAKKSAHWQNPEDPATTITAINEASDLRQMYFDLICSMHLSKNIFCIESKLNDAKDTFTTFNINYQLLDDEGKPTGEVLTKDYSNITRNDFEYVDVIDQEKHTITLSVKGGELKFASYSYQDAKIEQE